jgi:hypothetical protein
MKPYGGADALFNSFFNLDTTWTWVINLTALPLDNLEDSPVPTK